MADLPERLLCIDGNCIGTLNERGYCNVCGKSLDGKHDSSRLKLEESYVAAFSVEIGDGVTLERYRAPLGGQHGQHKMRLVHQGTQIAVEREYTDDESVFSVRNELVRILQIKLAEKGVQWRPSFS